MFSMRCHLLVRHLLAPNANNSCGVAKTSNISSSAAHWTTYYESLGIPTTSTQTDIKAAYYKLSMQYHPDKNQGCEVSAQKFREISQAYEVLGNYRLRRLYDKGVMQTAGKEYAPRPDATADDLKHEVEDDDDTKFYKSRFRKSRVADMQGRTPIYDFDEWSRAHYGKSFQRRQNAKNKFDRQQTQSHNFSMSTQNEIVIFGLIAAAAVMYVVFHAESSHDTPKKLALRRAEERKKAEAAAAET